jgi:hypothetical protein
VTRILLPGRIRRHLADVGTPAPFLGATWYPLTRLCDGDTKRAGSPFIERHCELVESADLTGPLICPDCLAAHRSAVAVVEDMGAVPLFDL